MHSVIVFILVIPVLQVCDPEAIKDITVTNRKKFDTIPVLRTLLKNAFGTKSIVSAAGEEHRVLRKSFVPIFNYEKVELVGKLTTEYLHEMIHTLKETKGETFVLNLKYESSLITSTVFGILCYGFVKKGKNITGQFSDTHKHTLKAMQTIFEALESFAMVARLPCPDLWMRMFLRKEYEASKNARKVLDTLVVKQYEKYEKAVQNNEPDDGTIIYYLIAKAIEDEKKGNGNVKLERSEIVNYVRGFFVAAFDGSSTGISVCFYSLAKHPEWQTKIREEVAKVVGPGNPLPGVEAVKQIPLLQMIFYEAMRMNPVSFGTVRQCVEPTTIANKYNIPAGLNIRLMARIITNDQDLWKDDVNEFNPLRFENGLSKATHHPMAFLPFSAGDRGCMGRQLISLQAQLILANLITQFQVGFPDGVDSVVFKHKATLQFEDNNIPLEFRRLHC